jgi:uncharacterized protein YfaS (alpha-2-macroglobulin family)
VDPAGRTLRGEALREARGRVRAFPPPVELGAPPWRCIEQGYRSEKIVEQRVTTNAEGTAVFAFTPKDEGFYRVRWRSDDGVVPITAETSVWVADAATTSLAYHHQGVELIVDADTFRAGETASVMISVPTNDRWVLLTVEGDSMHSHRLVHVTGTVKLIELPITARHIPNVRRASAAR